VTQSSPAVQLYPQLLQHPATLDRIVLGQATILAYEDVSLALGLLAFVAIPFAFIMPRPKAAPAAQVPSH
jgi:hypothetical protein